MSSSRRIGWGYILLTKILLVGYLGSVADKLMLKKAIEAFNEIIRTHNEPPGIQDPIEWMTGNKKEWDDT